MHGKIWLELKNQNPIAIAIAIARDSWPYIALAIAIAINYDRGDPAVLLPSHAGLLIMKITILSN